jgi:hypothetical protein
MPRFLNYCYLIINMFLFYFVFRSIAIVSWVHPCHFLIVDVRLLFFRGSVFSLWRGIHSFRSYLQN